MTHSIEETVALTGVSAFTLRNWEKRYDFLRPHRQANGFRAYSDEQVLLLRRLQGLILQGARIGDLASQIRRGLTLPELPSIEFDPRVHDEAVALYLSLNAYDQTGAERRLRALETRFSASEMLDLLYSPLLTKIGNEWASARANIAQEHFASAFIRLRLARLLTDAPTPAPGAPRLLLTTLQEEFHEGGLMVLASYLRLAGTDVYYLGSGLAIDEIRAAIHALSPACVGLSFTDPTFLRASLPSLCALAPTPVCIGGFAASLSGRDDRLPPHVRLLRASGREAALQVQALLKEKLSTRKS